MRRLLVLGLLASALSASRARADGFQLERYEPNAAGSWFLAVPHPWYSSTRFFAAGLTLDYAHNPLLGGFYNSNNFKETVSIVEHQLVGHVDVAGSFLDRILLSGSLPVVLLERGTSGFGVAPIAGAAVGDPRFGVMARLYGRADRAWSLHLGGYLWIPIGANGKHAGDSRVRGLPEIVVAGLVKRHLRYSATVGVLARAQQTLGFGPASTAASELQFGAALAWADVARGWQVGPELSVGTEVAGPGAWKRVGTSLELLVGAQYHIKKLILVGAGVGSGLASVLGSPDARALLRVAYAPVRKPSAPPPPRDSDGDGIADDFDACPTSAGPATSDRRTSGCPDTDHDGIPDAEDRCPREPPGAHPDASRPGCAAPDRDNDGVPDAEDACPNEPPGAHPDASRPGCAAPDRDNDGVPDAEDACPNDAPGAHPDASRAGCPLPDADADGVPDAEDACPKDPGEATSDRKTSGCPKLVTLRPGDVLRLRSVHFETNKWELLPESFPILDEVVRLLVEHPEIDEVVIEGHADDRGTHEWNLRLSRHRAKAVVDYVNKHGVRMSRLRYEGFGDTRPLDPERSDEARAKNRRVEVRIPDKK